MVLMESFYCSQKLCFSASILPCQILSLMLSISTYPSCLHTTCSKEKHFNPSNYRNNALISCFSTVFESLLNRKIQRHLSANNILSDRQFGFQSGRSTSDLLAFLSDSLSSSFGDFGETFAVALVISKAF